MDLASGSKLAPMSWTFAFADGNPCPPPYPFFRLEPPPVTRDAPRYLKLVYSSGFMSGTPVSYPDWHALVGDGPGGLRLAVRLAGVRPRHELHGSRLWRYPLMGAHTSSSLSVGARTGRTVSLWSTYSSAFEYEEPWTI